MRADGTESFQIQPQSQAAHFVLHDLSHYAVETVLVDLIGFFGLIERGWDIVDTTGRGARGPVPLDAIQVEQIVGLFDQERANPGGWSVDQMNAYSPRVLSESEFEEIRSLRADLFRRWERTSLDEGLCLTFPPSK